MHLNLDIKILIITSFVSLFTVYRKQNAAYLFYFPFFLFLTVCVEITGTWLGQNHKPNTLLYDLFTVILFPFYFHFFSQVIHFPAIQKKIKLILFFFPVLSLVDIFFIQGPGVFNTYTYSLGALLIVIMGVIYFFQLFNTNQNTNLLREPAFWIITGLLFSFATSLSLLGVINYVSTLSKNTISLLFKLLSFVNTILYILYIIAFICRLSIRKSTPNI
jgi:hypothetical protein